MATMRVMVLHPTKAAAWVHQWEDVVQEVTGPATDLLPLLPGSTVPTPSLPWSWCTDWIPWRWTPTGSSTSSVCMATWSGWVPPASALLRAKEVLWENEHVERRSVQFSNFSSVVSDRLSSWRVSQELQWWKWETATLWTAPSLTWTTPSCLLKEWTSGKLLLFFLSLLHTQKHDQRQPFSIWHVVSSCSVSKQQAIVPGQCYELEDGTSSFKDFHGSRNNRFTSPEQAAKNRIQHPSNVLHFFNAQPDVTPEVFSQVRAQRSLAVYWFMFLRGRMFVFNKKQTTDQWNVVSFTDLWGDWRQVPHQC